MASRKPTTELCDDGIFVKIEDILLVTIDIPPRPLNSTAHVFRIANKRLRNDVDCCGFNGDIFFSDDANVCQALWYHFNNLLDDWGGIDREDANLDLL